MFIVPQCSLSDIFGFFYVSQLHLMEYFVNVLEIWLWIFYCLRFDIFFSQFFLHSNLIYVYYCNLLHSGLRFSSLNQLIIEESSHYKIITLFKSKLYIYKFSIKKMQMMNRQFLTLTPGYKYRNKSKNNNPRNKTTTTHGHRKGSLLAYRAYDK